MSIRSTAIVLVALSVAGSAHAAPIRVAVLDVDSAGTSGADVAQLPDLISQIVAKHPGYEVVPVADVHHAVDSHQSDGTRCSTDNGCVVAVAHDTHADFAIVTSVTRHRKSYAIELMRVDGRFSATPKRATGEASNRSGLADAAQSCLDQLFKWPTESAPPPEPAAVVAVPPPPKAVHHNESLALISVARGEGISEKLAATIEELVLGALDATGKLKVIGRSDIDAVLSLEAKKESVGCTDTDCAVRIAGALGVDLVGTASIGRIGSTTLLTLKLIDVRTATVVGRAQQSVQSDNDLPGAARALAEQVVAARFGLPAAAVSPAPQPSPPTSAMPAGRVLGWIGVALGGAALAAGAGLGISSLSQQNEIHTTQRSGATALQIMNSSNNSATGADISLIAGGVLAAGGMTLVVVF